ncbi:OPT oligopeptide transporter protein-domain-containing protein [Linnemannia elongata]|nr:OPT oligopeptide transporter protein-domain-containing protein [Linnemannia elongata]
MATQVNEKSEYSDFPNEKSTSLDGVENKIDLQEEEDEFIDEPKQFTVRAVLVGSLLGLVVAASNMYTGLKAGWTFGAALWGSIFGFLLLKLLTRFTGGIFGPKENTVCQTAATAAGGLSAGFITAIPAMYRMGLMGDRHPREDVVALLLWSICSAFFGMFFAVPLRTHFVINQDLVFPTPRAAAETIKSLHRAGSNAAKDARESGIVMGASFVISMVWGTLAHFVPGLLGDLHILYYMGKSAANTALMNADAIWGWYFSWDFAFLGAGLMTPGSTVFSFMAGSITAFGIAGPLMMDAGYLWDKGGFVRPTGEPLTTVASAQSWFIWPGIAMMVFSSFSELGANWRSLYFSLQVVGREGRNIIRKLSKKEPLAVYAAAHVSKDTTPEHEQIPTSWWVSGLLVSTLFTILVMYFNFQVPVYATIGVAFLSFFLAFVGLQSTGETDINPTGAIGKVTQLVFARIPGADIQIVQKTNLMCANIAAAACSQAVDMVSDLKTAQLTKASPRAMLGAQFIGSIFAIAIAIPLFLLYAAAYPCILVEPVKGVSCQFPTPAVTAWANVCKLLTGGGTIPKEAMIATIVLGLLSVLNVIIRVKFVPDAWKPYWPNLNAFGLGFVNTGVNTPCCMLIGWFVGQLWLKFGKASHGRLMYSVAAGLISGIGIAGVVKAAFTVGGVPGKNVIVGCGPEGGLC